MALLQLSEIGATSPTLAETMRSCQLRAGLSRTNGTPNFVLGNPKAWLGNAYHEVLERIVGMDPGNETLEAAVDRLWDKAIKVWQVRAEAHLFDRRFGLPQSWPGYYVARASVLLRAKDLLVRSPSARMHSTREGSDSGTAREFHELELTAFEGRLRGRPDVIRENEVVDYKSGAILEHDAWTQTDVVKAAYVRQLRIYGYLVKESFGWWPLRGVLLPLAGPAIEVILEPSDCERESSEALLLLERYNKNINDDKTPEELASPSEQACQWCAYKLFCSAFWRLASVDWSGRLDGAALEGTLAEAPSVVHGGAARSIVLDITGGTEAPHRVHIGPFNTITHPVLEMLETGERVRIVGLRVRADGIMLPTLRTVVSRLADLPTVMVRAKTGYV